MNLKNQSIVIDPLRRTLNGEVFRRHHLYITQHADRTMTIECCDPTVSAYALTRETSQIMAFLDCFEDGHCDLVINFDEGDSLNKLLAEFPSLTPRDPSVDDGVFSFSNIKQRTQFLLLAFK